MSDSPYRSEVDTLRARVAELEAQLAEGKPTPPVALERFRNAAMAGAGYASAMLVGGLVLGVVALGARACVESRITIADERAFSERECRRYLRTLYGQAPNAVACGLPSSRAYERDCVARVGRLTVTLSCASSGYPTGCTTPTIVSVGTP